MISSSFPCVVRRASRLVALVSLACVFAGSALAQSTDVAYPTPVASNEITGRITPRDVGDARLTRHFYTFKGVEGDLVMTVESTNLDGDIDVFTANTLRPLAKVTLYAGLSATRVSKSVYLRQEDALILRVEARSAGDAEGSYRVRFEGAFAPASGTFANAPAPPVPSLPEDASRSRNVRRVTSSGARIDEPPTETAAGASGDATTNETPATGVAAAPPASTPRPARRSRPSRTPARRRTPNTTQPTATAPSTDDETAETRASETDRNEAKPAASAPAAAPARRRTPRARTSRNRPAPRTGNATSSTGEASNPEATRSMESTVGAAAPAAAAAVVTATRLVIETKDGTRIERDMSSVRRVTVESNQLVIVRRDGRTERVPMANVARMSIEP